MHINLIQDLLRLRFDFIQDYYKKAKGLSSKKGLSAHHLLNSGYFIRPTLPMMERRKMLKNRKMVAGASYEKSALGFCQKMWSTIILKQMRRIWSKNDLFYSCHIVYIFWIKKLKCEFQ